VIGVDVNPMKVEMLESGHAPVLEPGLSELLAEGRRTGRLHATSDPKIAVDQSENQFVVDLRSLGPRSTALEEMASHQMASASLLQIAGLVQRAVRSGGEAAFHE